MPDIKSDLRCFAGFQGGGRVSPRAYGAKGDAVADDTAAVRAAHDYCVSIGRGDVILDGAFRITDTLTWNSAVSLVGVGVSTVYMDHPSKDIFSITGSITSPTRFENFYVAAAQANTGTVFLCASGSGAQHILIRNVMTNLSPESGLVKGTIIYAGQANQTVVVQNCTLNVAAPVPSCIVTGGSNLVISDSFFSPPGTSTTMMIEVRPGGSAQISNSSFVGRPGGGVGGVFIYTNTSGTSTVSNCSFKGDGGTGTLWYAFGWAAGATVVHNNNLYGTASTPVNYTSPPPTLTDRLSKVDLLPGYTLANLNSVYTLLSGYRAAELTGISSSFTVNTPGRLFMGQRLRVAIKNGSVTNWAPVFGAAGIPNNMAAPGVLTVGSYGIYEFVVSDILSGSPLWLMTNNGQ